MDEKNSVRNDIPVGWEQIHLKDVCEIILGQSPPSETYNTIGQGLPFFQGKAEFTELYPTAEKWCSIPGKIAEKDDILLSIRAPVGKTNIADSECCIGRGLAALRYNNHKFLFYYLRYIEKELDKKGTGSTFKAISGDIVRNIDIPLPPVPEQQRIVAKIEELFSELDKGVEALKAAQRQLKVYRQAVLQRAFEGKLTEEWRKQQKHLPTTSQLPEQIKAEREKQAGATGKKLKSMLSSSEAELAKLPNGWQWVNLADVSTDIFDGPFGSHLKSSDYTDDGVRVIRLENIGALEFNDQYRSYVSKEKYETIKKHTVYPGDIVFSSFISEKIRVALVPSHIQKAVNKADCFCIRTNKTIIGEKYLACFLSTRVAYHQLVNEIHGATRPRINTTQLKSCWIPYCSVEEQRQIVSEIESRLSVADKIEETITQSLKQAEALRQSILKKAFEGKLIPQDPSDEPVEKLLARIRTEKAAQTLVKGHAKRKGTGRKTTTSPPPSSRPRPS
jgi:type I restriction enzyme S subunit